MARWRCKTCGAWHEELPLHYGPTAPLLWSMIPEEEREQRGVLTEETCLIDCQHAFILGNLEIPILGSEEPFSWDIWVSLSLTNFKRALQLWEDPSRASEPPYFGWFSSEVPGYPQTLLLKTLVHTREVGMRPRIELEPTDHPMAVEQRNGITWQRVQEMAELALHEPQD